MFGGLSVNAALPWSSELLEKYYDKWNWFFLSRNQSLPWTMDLLEHFKDNWDWKALVENTSVVTKLPKLSPQDIDEVMSYHMSHTD